MGNGGTRPQAVPETFSQQLLLSLPALRACTLPQGPRSACGQSEGPAAVTTSLSPLEDGVKDKCCRVWQEAAQDQCQGACASTGNVLVGASGGGGGVSISRVSVEERSHY